MSLVRSSLLVGLGAAASRILGFARDILFAQALGAGPVADAFLAAFRIPNLVRRIVGEGGLNPALIPVLGRLAPDEAAIVGGDIVTAFALTLLTLTGLVELAAGGLAFILAPGLEARASLDLVAFYTRLGFPSVFGIVLASIGAALLNARHRFAVATLAPLVVNGGLILTLLILYRSGQPPSWTASRLAIASSFSGFVQLIIVAIALARCEGVGFRRPRFSPLLKGILLAGLPALAAGGAAQIFVLAGTQVASFWPSGVSWLYYAERVMQLPLGLTGALGSSVLLPELAARYREGRSEAVIDIQNRAMALALLLALPAATALAVLARPIASVLFERGAFGPRDAAGTAMALAALSLALPFAAAGKVMSQTLFARGSLSGTMIALGAGLAGTCAAGLILGWRMGITGIALGVGIGCAAHAMALAGWLRALSLWNLDRAFIQRLGRTLLACCILAAGLEAGLLRQPAPGRIPLAGLCIGGFLLYAAAAWILGAVTPEDIRKLRPAT